MILKCLQNTTLSCTSSIFVNIRSTMTANLISLCFNKSRFAPNEQLAYYNILKENKLFLQRLNPFDQFTSEYFWSYAWRTQIITTNLHNHNSSTDRDYLLYEVSVSVYLRISHYSSNLNLFILGLKLSLQFEGLKPPPPFFTQYKSTSARKLLQLRTAFCKQS